MLKKLFKAERLVQEQMLATLEWASSDFCFMRWPI
jgi:hypothetical protein